MRAPGKTVADEFYIHLSAVEHIENTDARGKIGRAIQSLQEFLEEPPNVAKLNLRSGRVSLLSYPDFFESPFPTLQAAWVFSPEANRLQSFRTYRDSLNPPILHRKDPCCLERGKWRLEKVWIG